MRHRPDIANTSLGPLRLKAWPALGGAALCLCLSGRNAQAAEADGAPKPVDPVSSSLTHTLTRDDIMNFQTPAMGQPYAAGIRDGALNFLKQVSADPYTNGKLIEAQNAARPKPFTDQMLGIAAHQPAPDPVRDETSQKIQRELAGGAQRNIERQVLSYATFVNAFKSGLNFSFDPKRLFGGDAPATPAGSGDNVRYGLILKNIEANPDGYRSAAVGGITQEELAYAAKAKLDWTIGPVTSLGDERLFNVTKPAEVQPYVAPPTDGSAWSWVKYKWNRWRAPSPKVQGSFAPVAPELQPGQNAIDQKGLPPMRLSLWQEDAIYRYDYYTDAKGKKAAVNHTLGMNVTKRLRLTQTRDETMKVTRTSALNLLPGDGAPSLNVHYLNLEKRYQADYAFKASNVEMTFTVDTPPGWRYQKAFTQPKERYEFKVNKAF